MAETTLKECCGRYLCERCGGTGRQEAGCWDGKAYAAPAGTCDSCGGEGRLGFKDQTPVFPLSPPAAAPQTVDPLAELTRAKAAFDDPTTDREESTRALAVAAILAYHDLADRFSRLSASEAALEAALGMIDEMAQGWPTPNTYTERADSLRAALSVGGATGDGKGAEKG